MLLTADNVRTRSSEAAGEDNAKARAIGERMAVRRVVHLEHDVRSGLDELGLPGLENLRRLARCVADQKALGSAPASVSSSVLTFGAVKKTPAGWPRNHFDFGSRTNAMMWHDHPFGRDGPPPPESSGLQ